MNGLLFAIGACFCALLKAQAIDDLPPGVPRVVNPDGSLFFIEPMFTTREFQNEALRLVIEYRISSRLCNTSLPIIRRIIPQDSAAATPSFAVAARHDCCQRPLNSGGKGRAGVICKAGV
jgi:hypothetical protein